METNQHNNETQITERRFILTPRDKELLPIEDQLRNLFTFFGNEIDKAKDEYDTHLDQVQRKTLCERIKNFVNVSSSMASLLLILLSSNLSAKDLCSKKGSDELLRSSSFPTKFFFKHDCKKRKTYFSEEQARMVNDRIQKDITITVKMHNDEMIIITANQKGIVKTGVRMSWSKEVQWDKDFKRLDQLGLAEWK